MRRVHIVRVLKIAAMVVAGFRPELPVVAAASLFSNIYVTNLLPKETRSLEAGEA